MENSGVLRWVSEVQCGQEVEQVTSGRFYVCPNSPGPGLTWSCTVSFQLPGQSPEHGAFGRTTWRCSFDAPCFVSTAVLTHALLGELSP